MYPMYTIGLDLSLRCAGYAVLDEVGHPVQYGVFGHKLVKASETEKLERHASSMDFILKLVAKYAPGKGSSREWPQVAIEGYSFNSRFSREVLAELHGVVRYELWRVMGIVAIRIPPASARKEIGIHVEMSTVRRKNKGKWIVERRKAVNPVKEQVRVQLAEMGVRFAAETDDPMDAYVVARAMWMRKPRGK